jgi:hypothetical protein
LFGSTWNVVRLTSVWPTFSSLFVSLSGIVEHVGARFDLSVKRARYARRVRVVLAAADVWLDGA